jgi:hypothetical protein
VRRRLFAAPLLALVSGLLAAAALGGVAAADHEGGGGHPFTVALLGASEVPGPGDPDATGTAHLRLNPGQEEVCFELSVANVDGEIFAAHIHRGTVTEAGPVVVGLAAPVTGSSSGCVHADRELILAIIQNPENYYVNVHSRPNFPGGAVRGQLSK